MGDEPRTLPENLDAERAVLSAMLRDAAACRALLDALDAAQFSLSAHRVVFQAIARLDAGGAPLDAVTLAEELHRSGRLADAGGPAYIGDLIDFVGTTVGASHYAAIVRQTAARRAIIARLAELHGRAFDEDGDPDAFGAAALDALRETVDGFGALAPPAPLSEAVPEALARFRARAAGAEPPIPLPWREVAHALGGGLAAPAVHFLVGGTGSGKTQWALQLALAAAGARLPDRPDLPPPKPDPDAASWPRIPVLYIGLEMRPADLVARALGLLAGEQWSNIARGRRPALLDEARIGPHAAALAALPFHVEHAPPHGFDYRRIVPVVARMRQRYPLAKFPTLLVVLDYLQLLTGPERELRERIGNAAYALLDLPKAHGATVLAVSSTARTNYAILRGRTERKGDAKPWQQPAGDFVGLGKESGDVEFAADGVLVLASEPWPSPDGPPVGGTRMRLGLAKVRDGSPRWARLLFNGSRFDEPPRDGAELPRNRGPFQWGAPDAQTPAASGEDAAPPTHSATDDRERARRAFDEV